MDKAATAELLMTLIRKESLVEVEKVMAAGTSGWREVLRYEHSLQELTATILQYEILAPRLLSYEITTMSPLHLAALGGQTDIMIHFLDRDVPVDIPLGSGTTPLHVACFAGQLDMVKLLISVYKADMERTDRYAWGALHYAATEGNLEVCEFLVESGANTKTRDKDGTSAAYRAHANHHDAVTNYLVSVSNDEELLNIGDEEDEDQCHDIPDEPLYAHVWKSSSDALRRTTSESEAPPVSLGTVVPTPKRANTVKERGEKRKSMKQTSIRRLIRRELELAFQEGSNDDENGYMRAEDAQRLVQLTGASTESDYVMTSDASVSADTLTGVIREELKRYKDAMTPGSKTAAHGFDARASREFFMLTDDGEDYEELYSCLKQLGPAPQPPMRQEKGRSSIYEDRTMTVYSEVDDDDDDDNYGTAPLKFVEDEAPPLPPRNPNMVIRKAAELGLEPTMTLPSTMPTDGSLKAAMETLLPKLCDCWQDVARCLPLAKSDIRTEDKIEQILRFWPKDKKKQTSAMIAEWRRTHGERADVPHLVDALRKCGLSDVIPEVELLTSEFSA